MSINKLIKSSFNLSETQKLFNSMNLNLHCFTPQFTIAQTPLVYVPLFQSYPQYQFIVPCQNYYTPQSEQVINIQESIPQSDPQNFTNHSNNEQQSTSEQIKNDLNVRGLVQKNPLKTPPLTKNNQLQFLKESKNVQKNYAKAIASFISKNKELASKLLTQSEVDSFLELMKLLKNKIQNVCHISQYTNNDDFIKAFRILGYKFGVTLEIIFLRKENSKEKQPPQTQIANPPQSIEMLTQSIHKIKTLYSSKKSIFPKSPETDQLMIFWRVLDEIGINFVNLVLIFDVEIKI